MMYKYILMGAVILILPTVALVSTRSSVRRQEQVVSQDEQSLRNKHKRMTKEEFENQFPITDYSNSGSIKTVNKARQLVAERRYNLGQLDISEDSDTIITHTHWEVGLPALPVAESQAIVLGKVVEAQASLTSDKAVVYSEFEIQIDEVFKDHDRIPIPNSSITVTRSGGRVRFSSGHITLQAIAEQNMPIVGKRYLFFLTRENRGEDFHILTAYEFREGLVQPLDNPMGGTHPIAKTYYGVEQELFLRDLRAALNSTLSIFDL